MEHDPAATWLDVHLDGDGRWADAGGTEAVLVAVSDLEFADAAEDGADTVAVADGDAGWLSASQLAGLDLDVEQIVVDDAALAAVDGLADPALDLPSAPGADDVEPGETAGSGIVDPFDQYLASPDAPDPMALEPVEAPADAEAADPLDVETGRAVVDDAVDVAPPAAPVDEQASVVADDAPELETDDGPDDHIGPMHAAASSYDAFDLAAEPADAASSSLDAFDRLDWHDDTPEPAEPLDDGHDGPDDGLDGDLGAGGF